MKYNPSRLAQDPLVNEELRQISQYTHEQSQEIDEITTDIAQLTQYDQDFFTSGTWTPELWDNSLSGSEGQTYGANNEGYYRKVGDMVYVQGRLEVSSTGTLTSGDTARIGNLPFAPGGHGWSAASIGWADDLNITANQTVSGYVDSGNAQIILRLWDAASGTTALTVGEFSSTGDIIFNAWYITNE